jgi:hypothetical protein
MTTAKNILALIGLASLLGAASLPYMDGEAVQDWVGAMLTGNTETNITVTYDDPNDKINFVATGEGGGGTSLWTENGNDIYYTSGDVGIGTTTPGAALHVEAAISTSVFPFQMIDNTASGGYFRVQDGTSNFAQFVPTLWSKGVGSGTDRIGMHIIAEPGEDGADDAVVQIQGRLNGSAINNADILKVKNFTTELVNITASGNIELGSNGPRIIAGSGAPTLSAPTGSIYLRSDGSFNTTFYVREGSSWVAI